MRPAKGEDIMSPSDNTQLKSINQTLLLPFVQHALSSNTVEIVEWDYQQLHGAGGGVGGTAIYRFSGKGRQKSEIIPWSLILKVLQPGTDNDPSSSHYWKREAEAYRSGWLDNLSGGLVAPRCFGIGEYASEVWIWLEDVTDEFGQQWPMERYGLAARHLGQFNGIYLVHEDMPSWSWLSSQWIRKDLAAAAPKFNQLRNYPTHPILHRSLPQDLNKKAFRLWEDREIFLMALERLPDTVCHFDAFRQNLFARRNKDGQDQTVAIDWAFAGLGPLGVEIAALVWVTLAFMEVEAKRAGDLERIVFINYLDGLRDVGWKDDPRHIRFAFTAAIALRRLGTLGYTFDYFVDESLYPAVQQLTGHSVEEVADQFVEAGQFIENLADEARDLLDTLS